MRAIYERIYIYSIHIVSVGMCAKHSKAQNMVTFPGKYAWGMYGKYKIFKTITETYIR